MKIEALIAVVMVDMFSGVQRQTLEALELLEEHQVPYVIAIRNILFGTFHASESEHVDVSQACSVHKNRS